jgi:predicted adenylyl cyclase CyaB
MKNIELKIVLGDFSDIVKILRKNKAQFKGSLLQIDSYFNCKNGRLKLREINNKDFELIFYQRPDKKKSKMSNYQILKFEKRQANDIKAILKKSLGEKIAVRKERKLWIYKNTRIHLDRVDKLGNFLELETVIDKIDINKGKREHVNIIKMLKITKNKKLSKSYSDMIITKNL